MNRRLQINFLTKLILLAIVVFSFMGNTLHAARTEFKDVKFSHWAYVPIFKLTKAGIMSAGDDFKFEPGMTVERGELSKIIVRLIEYIRANPAPGAENRLPQVSAIPDTPTYVDVSGEIPSYKYIEMAKNYVPGEVIFGTSRTFSPERPAAKIDVIEAIIKLNGWETQKADFSILDKFNDAASMDSWERSCAAIAVAKKILSGGSDGMMHLNKPVTRAELCAIVTRAFENETEGRLALLPEMDKIFIPSLDSGFYDSYFDEAVFVGDSVSMGLRNIVISMRSRGKTPLGNARFLTTGSYGVRMSASAFNTKRVHPVFQGKKMPLEDCLLTMNAKEVYIMLGTNDLAVVSIKKLIGLYEKTLAKIKEKNPDIRMYVELCSPVTKEKELEKLNNVNIDLLNDALKKFCGEQGIEYVNIAEALKGGDNALRKEYSSDNFAHINYNGAVAWIDALREFAKKHYIAGDWKPAVEPTRYEGEFAETGIL